MSPSTLNPYTPTQALRLLVWLAPPSKLVGVVAPAMLLRSGRGGARSGGGGRAGGAAGLPAAVGRAVLRELLVRARIGECA